LYEKEEKKEKEKRKEETMQGVVEDRKMVKQ
jgi:hypothetical protein